MASYLAELLKPLFNETTFIRFILRFKTMFK